MWNIPSQSPTFLLSLFLSLESCRVLFCSVYTEASTRAGSLLTHEFWPGGVMLMSCISFFFSLFLCKLLKNFLLFWDIVDLQCCVHFRCIAKWFHYTYIVVQSLSHVWLCALHVLQHTRLHLELSFRVCSHMCPLSQWCRSTISSSVTLVSACPQSLAELQHQYFQWIVRVDFL